jgi:hypothetical protein
VLLLLRCRMSLRYRATQLIDIDGWSQREAGRANVKQIELPIEGDSSLLSIHGYMHTYMHSMIRGP